MGGGEWRVRKVEGAEVAGGGWRGAGVEACGMQAAGGGMRWKGRSTAHGVGTSVLQGLGPRA